MTDQTYTIEVSRFELHDICYALLIASTRDTDRAREEMENGGPRFLAAGLEHSARALSQLFDKLHALRADTF